MILKPTFLGSVGAVSGATISVHLAKSVASGLAIIDGSTYRVGQVGSFVRIPLGYHDLFGIVSDIGADAVPTNQDATIDSSHWMKIQLVGEAIGNSFERGISQHPNVNDAVHMVTETDLARIYGSADSGQVVIGRLSSAENIEVRIDLDKLVTRHSAVLGSTGSGKSTTVASLLRSISAPANIPPLYPSARVLLLDIHGEYAKALGDIAKVFRINPSKGEEELSIPYWALDTADLVDFLTGGITEEKAIHFYDKIVELKLKTKKLPGLNESSLTVNSPVPYSLKQLWFELIEPELRTLEGPSRDQPARLDAGSANDLKPPKYKPHAMGNVGPFLNTSAPGLKRQLGTVRSRLLDKQFDFLLHPGKWEPDLNGDTEKDLGTLLEAWLGHDRPITIIDLSGVPSVVLIRLVGAILKVIYEALFWSRDKTEGAKDRPLLVVMEEAHRYLASKPDSSVQDNSAREIVQRIVKEGRKYGMGAMIVSQRPSEVDETILSQCGTFVAMRLSNSSDRAKVQGTLPDSLAGLMDMLPVLRTGEAIITGEAARLPLRCRIMLPPEERQPDSGDPLVAEQWQLPRKLINRTEIYDRIVASWRAQSPRAVVKDVKIKRTPVGDGPPAQEK